eukprot:g3503.t1
MQRDLELAVNLLPEEFRQRIWEHDEHMELIELVLDYGRTPIARFPNSDFVLSKELVAESTLYDAVSAIGNFDSSNRAVLEGTLHRISCMRDREDKIYGLTIRIGRALTTKTAALVEEPLKAGKSVLLIGPPGVGKTSAIRNFCRMLSEDCKKRVMIVDTSNEIAGPGIVPHPATGSCRRMQVTRHSSRLYYLTHFKVKRRSDQHNVMVEAVQNHMPQVIVIDEIGELRSYSLLRAFFNKGKEEECHTARSIAQRGIQLLATTHGHTLEDMVKDRVLRVLVGDINDVVVGDHRAMNTKSNKKTVLERVDASCFDVIVEMSTRDRWRIHFNADESVDAICAGFSPDAEVRYLDKHGDIVVEKANQTEFNDLSSVKTPKIDNSTLGTKSGSSSGLKVVSKVETQPSSSIRLNPAVAIPPPEQSVHKPTKEAAKNLLKSLEEASKILNALAEAGRILSATSDWEVLQTTINSSEQEITQCFKTVYQKVIKTENEDKSMEKARYRLQCAYRNTLESYRKQQQQQQQQASVTSAQLKEAQRILNASTDLEVLQAKSDATMEKLRERFNKVINRVQKTENEDAAIKKARARVQKAYEQLLVSTTEETKFQSQVSTNSALQEAKRILKASSELEIFQISSHHTPDQLRKRFNKIMAKIKKVSSEDQSMAKARSHAQTAYNKLMLLSL